MLKCNQIYSFFQDFGLDQQDVAVLEYAYGLADISTGIYKVSIECGIAQSSETSFTAI